MQQRVASLCGCLALTVAVLCAAGAKPVHFRLNSGVAPNDEHPLPVEFAQDNLLWKTPLNSGHSTPCVCGDFIFLTSWNADEKELATVALDRRSGERKWKRVCPAERIEPFHRTGSPAASTPTCDGERVYSFFGSYGLLCYDLHGKLLWSKKMGPFQDEFGAASSPVLVDDKVILNEDHDVNSFLIAVNKYTGKTEWMTPRTGFTRSYSTPVIWDTKEGKQIVVAGALRLTAYDIQTGQPVWWVRGLSRIVDTTPVIADGRLYIATWTPGGGTTNRISMGPFSDALKKHDKNKDGQIGKNELPPGPVLTRFFRIDLNQDNKLNKKEWDAHAKVFELAQNVALAVRPGGKGDVTDTHVEWVQRRGLPTVPSPVVYKGVLFMVKDGGVITSVDVNTGKRTKQGRAVGGGRFYASIVAGDGKVYIASENGIITVLQAGKNWKVIGSHDFKERIMATPVIADGRMYIRTQKALYCFARQ